MIRSTSTSRQKLPSVTKNIKLLDFSGTVSAVTRPDVPLLFVIISLRSVPGLVVVALTNFRLSPFGISLVSAIINNYLFYENW